MTQGIPEPPEYLPHAAQQIWRAFAAQYAVQIADIPLFEQFCECYARYRQLMRRVDEVGPLVTIKGDVVTNPNLTRADKEAANYKHALALMLRAKHGRRNADEEPDEDTSDAQAFEALRREIVNRLTAAGEDAEGSAVDRQPDRDRPKDKAVTARSVRTKKETRSRPPTKEKP